MLVFLQKVMLAFSYFGDGQVKVTRSVFSRIFLSNTTPNNSYNTAKTTTLSTIPHAMCLNYNINFLQ